MKRLAIHKLRDRYFTPIFYTTYNAQFAHDYRLLCFQMYFRTRTGTMEPTKSHKVALINHSAILHLSRSIGVNGYVRNRFWVFCSASIFLPATMKAEARMDHFIELGSHGISRASIEPMRNLARASVVVLLLYENVYICSGTPRIQIRLKHVMRTS